MARGQKTCSKCGVATGPRAFKCPSCQTPFTFKKDVEGVSLAQMRQQRTGEAQQTDFDWRTLQRGDRIKVIQGSGPYFKLEDADPINMGYAGKFTVLYLTADCIHATGNPKEGEQARCVIYMGKPGLSKYGVYREPHKVVKLKQKKAKNV